MATKLRKQIYLELGQAAQLKQLAESSGLSEAEHVRRALNAYFVQLPQQPEDISAWEKEKQFIQTLIAQGPVEGGRTWKRDDLYDRQS